MNKHRKLGLARAALGALALAATVGASAQSFEAVFGANGTHEYGFKGVAPVVLCPGGGYIAVGSSGTNFLQLWCGPPPVNSRAYVVRTNAFGATLWEGLYSIGAGGGGFDIGSSIVELSDGSGFALTGTTDLGGGNDDVFLMKIKCSGQVVWAQIYNSNTNGHEYGLDVIEAASLLPGNPYDLVVAGVTQSNAQLACLAPGSAGNGLLMRTDANGLLRWSMAYDMGFEEALVSVIEATPPAGAAFGDLVAAGTRNVGGGSRAIVLRANPVTGAVAPGVGLQGMADYGLVGGSNDFRAVKELRSALEFPNLAMAGSTSGGGLYLAKNNGNPCAPLVDQVVQGVGGWDLVELQTPQGLSAAGDLAVAGQGFGDAILFSAAAATLVPVPGTALQYGDHGPLFDTASSLAEVPGNGFVIAGVSTSRFDSPLDPQDLYLVKTNPFGGTNGCEQPWAPLSFRPGYPVSCYKPKQKAVLNATIPPAAMQFVNQGFVRQQCVGP